MTQPKKVEHGLFAQVLDSTTVIAMVIVIVIDVLVFFAIVTIVINIVIVIEDILASPYRAACRLDIQH